MFRAAVAELGRILIYEAVRDDFLLCMEGTVQTPMGDAEVSFVDPTRPVKVRVTWVACRLHTCTIAHTSHTRHTNGMSSNVNM